MEEFETNLDELKYLFSMQKSLKKLSKEVEKSPKGVTSRIVIVTLNDDEKPLIIDYLKKELDSIEHRLNSFEVKKAPKSGL